MFALQFGGVVLDLAPGLSEATVVPTVEFLFVFVEVAVAVVAVGDVFEMGDARAAGSRFEITDVRYYDGASFGCGAGHSLPRRVGCCFSVSVWVVPLRLRRRWRLRAASCL